MLHYGLYNFIKILLVVVIITSCSSVPVNKNMNKNNILNNIYAIDPLYKDLPVLLFVNIENQTLSHIEKGTFLKLYKISSSYYGTGSKLNSLKTPLGRHEIYKKIGSNLPINAILKGRVWNGAIADIIKEPIDTEFDHVTSRILWLDGLELGKNKGRGIDSRNRYIYIHGTAEEGLIGTPASDGCIRMYNKDVVELFDLVDEKAQVWIY
tara:strand:- start:3101 stop:3727 length:627 start_codon:yes stop_codon:yes gene_type:complete